MATVTPTTDTKVDKETTSWLGIVTDDTVTAYALPRAMVSASLQFTGTFANGTTAKVQGSNDGSTWADLADKNGTAISATAAGYYELSACPAHVRIDVSSGSSDSVNAYLVVWKL